MGEPRAQSGRCRGEIAGAFGVDARGGVLFALRLVDGGIGGGVQDQVGPFDVHPRADGLFIADVERRPVERSEEHTSELQSLMRISYAVFCLKKKNTDNTIV